jgi:hypothetical protein
MQRADNQRQWSIFNEQNPVNIVFRGVFLNTRFYKELFLHIIPPVLITNDMQLM